MSHAETPADQSGGNAATPATEELASLPPRIRVHALAKLMGTTSKDMLATLHALGETARSAQSSVSRDVAIKVAEHHGVQGASGTGAPAADASASSEAAAGAEASSAAASGEQAPQGPSHPLMSHAPQPEAPTSAEPAGQPTAPMFAPPTPVFLPPEPSKASTADTAAATTTTTEASGDTKTASEPAESTDDSGEDSGSDTDGEEDGGPRRRRRRGRRGRGRGKGGDEQKDTDTQQGGKDSGEQAESGADTDAKQKDDQGEPDSGDDQGDSASRRRRRRRRRKGGSGDENATGDDPPDTVVHVRDGARAETSSRDQVRSVRGSTRLEAKRQRRRDGREAGRRRAPILSEAEFLARRESVDRTMIVRESSSAADRTTQIGVLEDGVLVEHFVTSSGSGSIVGNVYLGRVQNVLPSMEAAFVDIGKGRNAVLYAGEVDWDAAGLEGKSRKIEQALSTGDPVLVQVTKDPVGHKGARLTTQISLPGRFLVYVPGGGATGISRKLPENERRRLKDILKQIVPEDAGVIIRTASEGISADELERDVRRLQSQWETIKEKTDKGTGGNGKSGKNKKAPALLYEEPDLLVKVVRDLFTEDFTKLVVQGSVAWETINSYVENVAPDLSDRLQRYTGNGDVFADFRIDEQITKALDRKVWLPSGGYLVIDRTEAMTVIDVNTGKFTGSGGNLEETVTRNNLESAEEIVRQLRLRDIGGIIVIDFIDMVLESNRDLVLRRLTECLSRDRTRHQVAEVTSLGLVQMTRKRIGTGLLEAYSTQCEHCKGRGVIVTSEPRQGGSDSGQQGRKRGKGKGDDSVPKVPDQTPEQRETVASAVAAMANASKAAASKDTGAESAAAKDTGKAADAASGKDVKDTGEAAKDTGKAAGKRVGKAGTATEAGKDAAAAASAEPTPASGAVSGAVSPGVTGKIGGPSKSADAETSEQPAQEKPAATGRIGAPVKPAEPQESAAPTAEEPATPRPAPAPSAPESPASAEAQENTGQATESQAKPVRSTARSRVTRPAGAAAPRESEPAPPMPSVTTSAPATTAASDVARDDTATPDVPAPAVRTVRTRARRAASRPAGPPVGASAPGSATEQEEPT
ncbi:translation initiation factor IF-2 N-terminal domain-containing protein [Haloechinothrix halophila]|uniref:translation initiation factor IF-2 N-terminal domain-containing protein n=1 Tax=Haloechinothrix halophila TaxID=1069073 RepID=UPI0004166D7B|nr:translation initiation factor IF-2 N-terminal domain-containing protein [Haloechinothrix halophila]